MTQDRLMTAHILEEDLPQEPLDRALRPLKLNEFVGQDHMKDNLKVFIEAAKARGEPMDHVIFCGPPGLGKTTLAQIVANELGVGFKSTSGPVIARAGDLAAILTNLQPMDVLFIDEIHRLNAAVEEILYPAMEDQKLDIIIGEGPSARSIKIDLPPFTLVAATTRAGLITRPLRERFGIPLRLEFYGTQDLEKIVTRGADLLNLALTPCGANEIAKRSRGTPRIAGRLLRRLRDFATVSKLSSINAEAADGILTQLEVDSRGLDGLDRRYLTTLLEYYGGGPVGVETLAAALGEQRDVLEDVVEPYLMQQGFILRTAKGRMMGEFGYTHLGVPVPKSPE